jgi:hypothetical protein
MDGEMDDIFILDGQHYQLHDSLNNYTQKRYISFARNYTREVFDKILGFRGMIIRGGLGRGVVDEFSDIDFTCIFDGNVEKIKQKYGLRSGMHKYKGIMFSGRYVSLRDFRDGEWSAKMKHAYSYVKYIECDQEVKRIVKKKTFISKEERLKRLSSNIIELGEICKVYDKYYGFEMFSEIYKQHKRGESLTANLEIDRALRYVKNIIFDLNKIHYPEEKSYYTDFFSSLPVQPKDFGDKIKRIMEMPRDEESLNRKIFLLVELSKEVLDLCEKKVKLPKDIYKFVMHN